MLNDNFFSWKRFSAYFRKLWVERWDYFRKPLFRPSILCFLTPSPFQFYLISYLQTVTFLTFENTSTFLFSLQITFSKQRKFFFYLDKYQL